jgi:hypothetical protein
MYGEIICAQLLIKLLGAEFLLALVLKETDNGQHQKKDAEKVQEKAAV